MEGRLGLVIALNDRSRCVDVHFDGLLMPF